MKKEIVLCINLILVMLVTGVFWGTWFTLTRSIEAFPADNFINIGKAIIGNVAWPMRVLLPLTLLVQLLLCLTTTRFHPSFYFFIGSFIFMLTALLITLIVEVPIDNMIKTWTVNTIPDNWEGLRARWAKFHAYRTFASILSFALLSIGTVQQRSHPNITEEDLTAQEREDKQ